MELTASAILPFDDAAKARAALRARLQHLAEQKHIPEADLDRARLLVAGPTVITDAGGRRWFEWAATLTIRPPAPPRDLATPLLDDRRPTVNDLGLLQRRAG